MKAYGEFLLSGYVTGGKLTCLYRGIEDRHTSIETKEKNMNTVINASFSWKKKKGGNIDIDSLILARTIIIMMVTSHSLRIQKYILN